MAVTKEESGQRKTGQEEWERTSDTKVTERDKHKVCHHKGGRETEKSDRGRTTLPDLPARWWSRAKGRVGMLPAGEYDGTFLENNHPDVPLKYGGSLGMEIAVMGRRGSVQG
jgi:hypothetical protein